MAFAVTTSVKGVENVTKKLDALADLTQVKKAIQAGALMIESDAKQSIQQGGTGRVYRRHGISHTASSPGDPPATDTGALVSSIQHWTSEDGLSVAVGSRLQYAAYDEFGTRYMEPRPFIHPALDKNREQIVANIKAAIPGAK
jgi:HK97 gp10 family phage protein